MSETTGIVPLKKILVIINSCETNKQLKSAGKVIDIYIKLLRAKGLINPEDVEARLMREWKQKRFQINMIKSFVVRQSREFEMAVA